MNHSENGAYLRAETRRAAEVTTFLLMFRNYVSAVLGKEHLPTMEAISEMSAVDDIDELIEQFHLAQGEFVKETPSLLRAPLTSKT